MVVEVDIDDLFGNLDSVDQMYQVESCFELIKDRQYKLNALQDMYETLSIEEKKLFIDEKIDDDRDFIVK